MSDTLNPFAIDTDTMTGEMKPIRRAVISIGSNLGDREANLQEALDQLADTPDLWVTGISPVYETTPIEATDGSGDYLNAVILIDTTVPPRVLLERAMAIEEALGRARTAGVINEPRTIDVDLIVVGDKVNDEPSLILPHPRAAQRAFVLQPWFDVEADAEIPGYGTVAELLAGLGDQGLVRTEFELTSD